MSMVELPLQECSNSPLTGAPTNSSNGTRQVIVKAVDDVIFIAIRGDFDIGLNYTLRELCQPQAQKYQYFVVTFSYVEDLRDSGLAWLLMFQREIRRFSASLLLCNCRSDIADRCSAAGLLVI